MSLVICKEIFFSISSLCFNRFGLSRLVQQFCSLTIAIKVMACQGGKEQQYRPIRQCLHVHTGREGFPAEIARCRKGTRTRNLIHYIIWVLTHIHLYIYSWCRSYLDATFFISYFLIFRIIIRIKIWYFVRKRFLIFIALSSIMRNRSIYIIPIRKM